MTSGILETYSNFERLMLLPTVHHNAENENHLAKHFQFTRNFSSYDAKTKTK